MFFRDLITCPLAACRRLFWERKMKRKGVLKVWLSLRLRYSPSICVSQAAEWVSGRADFPPPVSVTAAQQAATFILDRFKFCHFGKVKISSEAAGGSSFTSYYSLKQLYWDTRERRSSRDTGFIRDLKTSYKTSIHHFNSTQSHRGVCVCVCVCRQTTLTHTHSCVCQLNLLLWPVCFDWSTVWPASCSVVSPGQTQTAAFTQDAEKSLLDVLLHEVWLHLVSLNQQVSLCSDDQHDTAG